MLRGSLTGYIDVAQITLYAFLFFFAGIVYYLHREDKREGYPLEAETIPRRGIRWKEGFPFVPRPKIFKLFHGGDYAAPNFVRDPPPAHAKPVDHWPGSPLRPTGDPMRDGVGPASYAARRDEPEAMIDGSPMIVPMRIARETSVDLEDADPRGMEVVGADGARAGVVSDIWVDLAEPQIRYYEVSTKAAAPTVMLPAGFARVSRRRRQIKVNSILASQFAHVPPIKSAHQITKLEEDRIMAYFGSGHLYAKPSRLGPLL